MDDWSLSIAVMGCVFGWSLDGLKKFAGLRFAKIAFRLSANHTAASSNDAVHANHLVDDLFGKSGFIKLAKASQECGLTGVKFFFIFDDAGHRGGKVKSPGHLA